MRPITLAVVAALLGAGSAALAQAPKPLAKTDFLKTIDTRFNAMDTNHDGVVTKAELAAELQRELEQARQLTTQKLRQQFQQLDTNHDGQLSFAEFSAVIGNIRSAETPDQKLQELDTNHDGKISAAEYRAPELARFNKVDANHDGVITQAEIDAAKHK
jgi:Ca2+-binding EF-hand superfamily protein